MKKQNDDVQLHVLSESIAVGEFALVDGYLRADLNLVLGARIAGKEYQRFEQLTLFVAPCEGEVTVEAKDSILDFRALAAVAEHVAVKLNTKAGRALLKMAADDVQDDRQRPRVRVPLPSSPAD